jgi:5-methylcytosine-specific restriction endonuclease McrA
MNKMLTKTCSKCNKELPATTEYFYKKKDGKYGLRTYCKECCKAYGKAYSKAWYKANSEKRKAYGKAHREANSEKRKAQKKAWNEAPALYDTYAHRLFADETRRDPIEPEYLQVRCRKCSIWMRPTNQQCQSRIQALNTANGLENNFYCSIGCKNSCSIFHKSIFQEGHPNKEQSSDRPYQQEWSNEIIRIANNECERCGATKDLQAHHIKPVKTHPHLQADLDNGVCLCKDCHKKVHQDECSTGRLANMICN